MLELLTLALPGLVALVVGWLSHDKLAPWANELIAFAMIIVTAVFWAVFVRSLTGNVMIDSLILVAYIGALIAGPLKQLYAFATLSWPSPLAALLAKLPAAFLADHGAAQTPVMPRAAVVPRGQLWALRPPTPQPAPVEDITQTPTAVIPSVPPPKPPQT